MFNNSYNSLSRSQTPNSFNTANRPSPSPKCFGKNTHVLKEEYEREKVRWQAKLDEAEQKLNEAAINNSELFQIKAELNRKIIDFEKNQRPLIEQNRRLNERIRVLTGESKTLEQKLCHSQDDFLSLRDAFERLTKENSTLKEQRAFPEKLEELSRYRSQVLDYSKCITACRQSILEKDRRYDLLVQKFKKYRKCLLSKRNGIDSEDDRQSCVGSEEGSLDSSSLTGLDTIAEDLDEDVELTAELLRPTMTPTEYSLKQQLDLANMTILELQNSIEFVDMENSNKMTTALERAQKLKEEKEQLELLKTKLEKDLANSQEHNDLLEFQLVELTEGSQRRNVEFLDKQCATEIELAVEDIDQNELEIKTRASVTPEFIIQTRVLLHAMLCKSALIGKKDREGLRSGIEVIDSLQNQLAFSETELNMCNCELKRVNRQFEEEISELKLKNEEFTTKKQQKKKELQAELEGLRKEKKEESKKAAKQIQDLNNTLNDKLKEISDKTDQIRQLNGEVRMFKADLEKLQAKSMLDEQKLETLTAELETAIENFARSHAEATLFKEQGEASDKRLNDERNSWQTTQQSLKTESEALQNKAVNQAQHFAHQLKDLEQKNKISGEEARSLQVDLETAKQAQKQLQEQLQTTIRSMQQQKQDMLAEQERLNKELEEAHALSQSLRAQIRPIGSQLERRYEEERYRLSEALKKIDDLENSLATSNQTIADLQLVGDNAAYLQKMQQLQTYNQELEQQFNSQMDMITALKKKFIVLKGGNISNTTQCQSSVDSIGWTSNSSEGTNSVDEEEEDHSEGEENRTAIERMAVATTKQSS